VPRQEVVAQRTLFGIHFVLCFTAPNLKKQNKTKPKIIKQKKTKQTGLKSSGEQE